MTEPGRLRGRLLLRLVCGLLAQGLALGALAQALPPPQEDAADLSLEQLLDLGFNQVPRGVEVSTASRFAQGADHAPAVTYVMTDQDIARLGLRSLADILRSLPGLYITNGPEFVFVGARGLGRQGDYNARLLYIVDGVRINEDIYGGGLVGPEFYVDADLIERVEFTPGPGSALYGNNAFLGVVNVTTKRAAKLQGAQARLWLDSDRLRHGRVSWGRRFENGAEAALSFSAFSRTDIDGTLGVDPAAPRARSALNGDRGQHAVGTARWGDWSLASAISYRDRTEPYAVGTASPPELAQGHDVNLNHYVSAGYEHSFDGGWDLSANLAFKRSYYRHVEPFRDAGGLGSVVEEFADGQWFNFDSRVGWVPGAGHYLIAGLELQRDFRQHFGYGSPEQPVQFDFRGQGHSLGVFAQDEWTLNPAHRLILGLRWDGDRRASQHVANPRLAWIWNAGPQANLKLLHGRAFRGANVYETSNNEQLGRPGPRPERVGTTELSWEQGLGPRAVLRISAFDSRVRQLIDLDAQGLLLVNGATWRIRGGELGLEQRFATGAQLDLGLSLQRNSDAAGRMLENSPRRLAKARLTLPVFGDAWHWGLHAYAQSARQVFGQRLSGYALLNTQLQWRPGREIELALGVDNLAGARHDDLIYAGYPLIRQPGRVVTLGLTWRGGS